MLPLSGKAIALVAGISLAVVYLYDTKGGALKRAGAAVQPGRR